MGRRQWRVKGMLNENEQAIQLTPESCTWLRAGSSLPFSVALGHPEPK